MTFIIGLKRFIRRAKKKKKRILLICFLLKKVEGVPFLLGATVFCQMAFSVTTFSRVTLNGRESAVNCVLDGSTFPG
jgi:hypothetical protein